MVQLQLMLHYDTYIKTLRGNIFHSSTVNHSKCFDPPNKLGKMFATRKIRLKKQNKNSMRCEINEHHTCRIFITVCIKKKERKSDVFRNKLLTLLDRTLIT